MASLSGLACQRSMGVFKGDTILKDCLMAIRLISPADARQPPQQLPPVLAAEDAASAPLPASALSGPVTDRPAEAGPVSKRKLGASPAKKPRLSIGAGSSGKGKGKAKHGLARELQELLRAGGEAHAGQSRLLNSARHHLNTTL